MIESRDLFDRIFKRPVREQYEDIVSECVEIKRRYVADDEFDTGMRMKLNFGHTFGHAIEACSDYGMLHGEGVAKGMAAITKSAAAQGICGRETEEQLLQILEKYGLDPDPGYTSREMIPAILSDKKTTGDKIRLIVPERVGACRIVTIGQDDLETWLKYADIS